MLKEVIALQNYDPQNSNKSDYEQYCAIGDLAS